MNTFSVTILGSNSARPAYKRHPTAQVVNVNERCYLFDCGEATQMQMMRYRIRPGKINHIFISHLHGDHFLGLLPLLDSYLLSGRTAPIHLYAPADLLDIINIYREKTSSGWPLSYKLYFHALSMNGQSHLVMENNELTIHSLPMKHSVACCGFLIKEKDKGRKIKGSAIKEYNIPYTAIPELRAGQDYLSPDGKRISNNLLTVEGEKPRAYAFFADTAYNPDLAPLVNNADLLYHETTYLKNMNQLAQERGHATTEEAATFAKQARVKKLIIGHFSSRYKELGVFLEEAKTIFPNTELATEGRVFNV